MYKKVLISALMMWFLSATAWGATYYYDSGCGTPGDGTVDACTGAATDRYSVLQTAINNTPAGNTILIKNGNHTEFNVTLDKALTIQGETKAGAVFRNNGVAANGYSINVNQTSAGVVVIEDLTFENNSAVNIPFDCIRLADAHATSNITIDNCDFKRTGAVDWAHGMIVRRNAFRANLTVTNCTTSTAAATPLNSRGFCVTQTASAGGVDITIQDNVVDIDQTTISEAVIDGRFNSGLTTITGNNMTANQNNIPVGVGATGIEYFAYGIASKGNSIVRDNTITMINQHGFAIYSPSIIPLTNTIIERNFITSTSLKANGKSVAIGAFDENNNNNGIFYIYDNIIVTPDNVDFDRLMSLGDSTDFYTNPSQYIVDGNILIGPEQTHAGHANHTTGICGYAVRKGAIKNNYIYGCAAGIRVRGLSTAGYDCSNLQIKQNVIAGIDSALGNLYGWGMLISGIQYAIISGNTIISTPPAAGNFTGGAIYNIAPGTISYNTGNNATPPIAGNSVTGAPSGASATVEFCWVASGGWAGGDGAGHIIVKDQTGTFALNDVLTIAGGAGGTANCTADQVNIAPTGTAFYSNTIILRDNAFPFIKVPAGYTSSNVTITKNSYGYWNDDTNESNFRWDIGGVAKTYAQWSAVPGPGFDLTYDINKFSGGSAGRNIGFGYYKQ